MLLLLLPSLWVLLLQHYHLLCVKLVELFFVELCHYPEARSVEEEVKSFIILFRPCLFNTYFRRFTLLALLLFRNLRLFKLLRRVFLCFLESHLLRRYIFTSLWCCLLAHGRRLHPVVLLCLLYPFRSWVDLNCFSALGFLNLYLLSFLFGFRARINEWLLHWRAAYLNLSSN